MPIHTVRTAPRPVRPAAPKQPYANKFAGKRKSDPLLTSTCAPQPVKLEGNIKPTGPKILVQESHFRLVKRESFPQMTVPDLRIDTSKMDNYTTPSQFKAQSKSKSLSPER